MPSSAAPGGNYRLTREEPVGAGRKGYFVVEASDRRNGVGNTFGLWRLALSADGKPLFEYRMDGFEQANSRCCDAVSYYPLQLTSRNEVIRAAQLAQSPACFYPVMEERGIIRTEAGQTRRIRIEAWDDCGNRSQLEFDILGRTESFRAKSRQRRHGAHPRADGHRPPRARSHGTHPRRSALRTGFLPR